MKGNAGRKILGGAVVAGSALLGMAVVGLKSWAAQGEPIGMGPALPFIGAAAGGVMLMGQRSYDTARKWRLVIIEKEY